MSHFTVLDAPSILGLRPSGVEYLPLALKAAGLIRELDADYVGAVPPPAYSTTRDETTQVLNPQAIRDYAVSLADAVQPLLAQGRFPLVLGGDCSILLGNLLALRRIGRYGLFFLDGHADFYQPEASPTGEVADMELAFASGRGPAILTDLEGLRPLVRDEDVVVFGYRDEDESAEAGSRDIRASEMHLFPLALIREASVIAAANAGLRQLARQALDGFWIHLDVDVLHDEDMPAVDYRLPGGLRFYELREALRLLHLSGHAVGMDVTIFNPLLDRDGRLSYALVRCIAGGLR
ncbi:MAG: arginase family protein [Armatimonadota bacterium]